MGEQIAATQAVNYYNRVPFMQYGQMANNYMNYMPQSINSTNDDIFMMGLYNQLNNGQMNTGTASYMPNYSNAINPAFSAQQAQGSKKGIGGPLLGGLAVGGATYAGMNFLNHPFNSPIETLEGGKVQFTEKFMNHFAGEYAAVKNGEEIEKFYKNFGHGVNAENIETVFQDLQKVSTKEGFANIEKLAKNNKELKAVLVKNNILDKSGKLINPKTALNDVQMLYTKNILGFRNINSANNLRIQSEMLERAKGLEEAWKACKNNKAAKIEFLTKNADILGLTEADMQKLIYSEKLHFADLNRMYKKTDVKTYITNQEKTVKNLSCEMQKFARKWNKDAGFFTRGEFKGVGNTKIAESLTKALKSMRRSRSWIVAGIAAVGTAIIWACSRNKS